MSAPDVPPCHSSLERAITGLTVTVLGSGTLIDCPPDPSQRAQMTVLLAMAGLVATSLRLWRRDRHAHEWRPIQETATHVVAKDHLVITRELHDAVSGNLGAITMCCVVARRLETTPDGLRTALGDVETAFYEATGALRRTLATLRDENMPPMPGALTAVPTGDTPAAGPDPVNSLAESLRELVGRAHRTGVTVDLDADAPRIGADAGIAQAAATTDGLLVPTAQTAIRVVAEALASTARHAGPTHARVALRRELGWLCITAVDGRPATGWEPHPEAGQGLRGLHKIPTALGGTLTAGPRVDASGFTIETILPILIDGAAGITSSTRGFGNSTGPKRRPISESPDIDPRSDKGKS